MSEVFPFDEVEKALIERMYKKRMPSREIAKLLDKAPIDVSTYINMKLVKRHKPQTIIGKPRPEVVVEEVQRIRHARVTGGLRHYTDPLAARDGSRKLLEALHAYHEKQQKAQT